MTINETGHSGSGDLDDERAALLAGAVPTDDAGVLAASRGTPCNNSSGSLVVHDPALAAANVQAAVVKTRTPNPTLSLDDLGHDSDRDRVSHLFPLGYDNTVPQVARCGTLIHPPFHPRREAFVGDPDLCLVCVEISLWLSEMDDLLDGS